MIGPHNRILAIDDDETIRLMLTDILGREQLEIVCVADGELGLNHLKHHPVDLVLLDVLMPGLDGFECLSRIRQLANLDMLPVVMLTGIEDLPSINRCFELGATDFISKPINWSTLAHRLRYLMRGSHALTQLAKSEKALRNLQKIAHLGSWEWSITDNSFECSEQARKILGWSNLQNSLAIQDFYSSLADYNATVLSHAIDSCLNNGSHFQVQLHAANSDDGQRDIIINGEPTSVIGDRVMRIQGTIQDVSEHQRIKQQLDFLVHYDPLTGLPNRTLFKEMLNQTMAFCHRHNQMVAALFLSIDRFKRINETLGSNVGDELLKAFVARLTKGIRECDYLTIDDDTNKSAFSVSRLGGNKFTVLLSFIKDSHDAVKVAKRIFEMTSEPFVIDEHEIYLWLSIGIAIYPGDGLDVDSLIKNGEFAMGQAQERGQNTYQFYSKSLNAAAIYELSMENQLRGAIERNELVLHYQPKINIRERSVIGCEALIRWQHPEAGMIPPSSFIPIAEHSRQIITISDWVLKTACQQLSEWRELGLSDLVVAINISARHFRENNFVHQVGTMLTQLKIPPRYIKLELTESVLLQNSDEVMGTLKSLRALGVDISIDDFGTGYSSLAYLKKLPISELKIDRSFIHDIPNNEDDMAITHAILALAKSLSLEVVAEGVEAPEQAQFLIEHGCNIAQGYLYSRPVPADEFLQFVQQFDPNCWAEAH